MAKEVSDALAQAAEAWEDDETEAPVEEDGSTEEVEAPTSDQSDTDEGDGDELEGSEEEAEVPTSYFGTDLSHITDPQARQSVIDALEEQNRTVNKRLQEIAELRKEALQAQKPEPLKESSPSESTEEPTITQIMENIGVDVNHPYYDELKDFLEPIALKAWEADQSVKAQTVEQSEVEFVRQFTSDLDSLEKAHGDLPYEREAVLNYADERGLYDPTALYWSIMGPLKEKAIQETAKRVNTAEEQVRRTKKAVAGTKPRTSAKGTTEAPKARTLAEILAQAEERTGQSLLTD